MDPVAAFLLGLAGVLVVGAIGELLFERTRVPDVVGLVVFGIVLGATGAIEPGVLRAVLPYVGGLALVVVLFDAGGRLALDDLRQTGPRAVLLAVAGFTATTLAIALLSGALAALGAFEGWSFGHGVVLGATLGGSSALVVMPSMRLGRVADSVAKLVNLESAITDVLCVLVTVAVISVMPGAATSDHGAVVSLLVDLAVACVLGAILAIAWVPISARLGRRPITYPLTIGALCAVYAIVDVAGGSPAVALLVFAVILANAPALAKRFDVAEVYVGTTTDPALEAVHGQITFVFKALVFTFVGLMLGPPWSLLLFGALFGAVCFVVRAVSVWATLRGSGYSYDQRKVVTISLPRGMAAAVLATLPARAGVAGGDAITVMVVAAVTTTVAIFAVGLPLLHAMPRPIRGRSRTGAAAADGPDLARNALGAWHRAQGPEATAGAQRHPPDVQPPGSARDPNPGGGPLVPPRYEGEIRGRYAGD